jgi:Domain of unknown function (DUF4386)
MRRRTTARIVGLLFIIATGAGVLSVVLLGPQESLQSLDLVAEQKSRLTAGAVAVLIMATAIAMIPPVFFPVLKEHGEGLALGYLVARSVEVVLLLPAAVGPLVLLAVSSSAEGTDARDAAAQFQTVRILTRTYETWGPPVSAVFFCLSVVLLNYLLYRSRLVPRSISVWALAAAVPYLAGGFLAMFELLTRSSTLYNVMMLPLALNEMVLAIWLLVRGFAPAAKLWPPAAEAVPALPSLTHATRESTVDG